ncbi:serine/threonine-protein kinase ctr1 [Quercus suber]|uniref:Serine/threonine-protein kinase ctr1 n=1 Tax=Quercus suber TaxID=58331 RepID=A0AAW0LMG2_QUESU
MLFSDAWTISTDLQDSGQIPSFESLKAIDPCDDLSIKVVLIDKSRDPGLKELQNRLRSLSGGWITTKDVIGQLATLVCNRMGGAVFTEEHLGAHWEEYTEFLKRCLGSVVLPIGSLSVGRCVHRALLFKNNLFAIGYAHGVIWELDIDKKVNYAVKVHGFEVSPYPVVSGRPATFNISASTGNFFYLCEVTLPFVFLAGKAISSGKAVIEVS